MKRAKDTGFILTLVIIILGLTGIVMFVLTEGSNTMLFQADAAYLQAVQRNLVASGLTWAQHHIAESNEPGPTEPLELDVASLGTRVPKLTVRIEATGDTEASVAVETACTKGRQTLNTSQDYTISLR